MTTFVIEWAPFLTAFLLGSLAGMLFACAVLLLTMPDCGDKRDGR